MVVPKRRGRPPESRAVVRWRSAAVESPFPPVEAQTVGQMDHGASRFPLICKNMLQTAASMMGPGHEMREDSGPAYFDATGDAIRDRLVIWTASHSLRAPGRAAEKHLPPGVTRLQGVLLLIAAVLRPLPGQRARYRGRWCVWGGATEIPPHSDTLKLASGPDSSDDDRVTADSTPA